MITIKFLRQFRITGYALFDLIVSFAGIYLLSPLLTKLFLKIKVEVPKKSWIFLTLPIGILAHVLANNITPMTKNVLDMHGHYILKLFIIGSLILGLKDIKIVRKH